MASGLALETAPSVSQKTTSLSVSHPLEPLSGTEIAEAIAILRSAGKLTPKTRIAVVVLNEPPKAVVLGWSPGQSVPREVFVQLLDNADGQVYEAIVSLTDSAITGWTHIPNVQPGLMLDEFFECEDVVKKHPDFLAALAKRGVTDPDLAMVDPWSAGWYDKDDERGIRLARALTFIRSEPGDNGYARPLEGVIAYVDLNKMEVLRIEDHGVVPFPPEAGNYSSQYITEFRPDLKPIDIVQSDGPSFAISGHEVKWQKWSFRIGFTPREGLVLYTLGYEDGGRVRPILYRASLSEMVVPYGDPSPAHNRKNAFDVGEYGIGNLANALELGCDCLGEIKYFDAFTASSRGEVTKMPNVICMHEEDYGILWKHVDWRTNQTEVRRSRRLVISFIATVGNYEYGFYWYLYQDGNIQFEIKLTGIMNTGALPLGETRKYGTLVAPGLYAPNHLHHFNVRLDMSVDGVQNSVYEVHSESEPAGPDNPHGNAYFAKSTLLKTESEAQQMVDPLNGRYWKIANPHVKNALGQPVAYKLAPGDNVRSFMQDSAYVTQRAGFIAKHLWVTPYAEAEKYATGDFPNQSTGGDGLPEWTKADRPIEDTDLVVWYTLGHNHIPRPEDWPVMPVAYIGFMLKPVGFFDRSPALDVPPTAAKCCASSHSNGNGTNGHGSNGANGNGSNGNGVH